MKSESGIIGWAMKYNKIILLIVIVLSLFGIYALNVMPKQEFLMMILEILRHY